MPSLIPICLLIANAGAQAPSEGLIAHFPHNTRVLFQGDSITDAGRNRDGKDPNNKLGSSYAFYIGTAQGATADGVTYFNRGISGNRVTDLEKRWQKDTLDLKPDILSILIGINDLNGGVSASDFEAQYDRLLARTTQALPKVKLVIIEPFALPTGTKADGWDAFLIKLNERQVIAAKLANKYGAVLIKMQLPYDAACLRDPMPTWIGDGIHPTPKGQLLMAQEWVKRVNACYGVNQTWSRG